MDDAEAAAVLKACAVRVDELRDVLVHYLDEELKNLIHESDEDAKQTAGFQRVIQRALIHVQSSGSDDITGANVMVAIF